MIDPNQLKVIGSYDASGPVYPDTRDRLTYFLSQSNTSRPTTVLKVFELDTFSLVADVAIPGVFGEGASLTKASQGIVAFRTDGEVFLINGAGPVAMSAPTPVPILPVSTATEIPVPTLTPLPTETPTPAPAIPLPWIADVPPGTYLLRDRCTSFPVTEDGVVMANINLCVTSVTVEPDRKMRFYVSWTSDIVYSTNDARFSVGVLKESDVGNPNMNVTDNLGNRYDHIDLGGAAALNTSLSIEGEVHEGWYLFPPAKPEATSFTFHDDDQHVAVEGMAFPNALNMTVTSIHLVTNDLIYDPIGQRLFASVPGNGGPYANSVVPIDVATGTMGEAIPVGPEPGKLAISDNGQYLYVGLDGAEAIRRIELDSQTADIEIRLPRGDYPCEVRYANDIAVLTDQPHTIAVALVGLECRSVQGIAIFDDDVLRAVTSVTPMLIRVNTIEPSLSGSTFYGYDQQTENGFYVLSVDSSEIAQDSKTLNLLSKINLDIHFVNGLVYATDGTVIDPNRLVVVGAYKDPSSFPFSPAFVVPDPAEGLIYFLSALDPGPSWASPPDPDGWNTQLKIFDLTTFSPVASFLIPGILGQPSSLTDAGQEVVAFRTSGGQIFFVRGVGKR